MDKVLHAERLNGRAKRLHRRKIDRAAGRRVHRAGRGGRVRRARRRAAALDAVRLRGRAAQPTRGMTVDVLTPPAILAVLAAGYPAAMASER